MNPRNFPELTLKAHLVGLRRMLHLIKIWNLSAKSAKYELVLLLFNYHVVYIYFDVPLDLVLEHFIHHPLICCPCVFQSK